MTTTLVRLAVQDGRTLSVLFVRVPESWVQDGRVAVAGRVVAVPECDPAGYWRATPVFARAADVTRWLSERGWAWRRAEPAEGGGDNWQLTNPYGGE